MNVKFQRLRREFIKEKPELAKILVSCKVKETNTVDTMGVSITNQPNLFYNPSFLNRFDKQKLIAVLVHEMYHLLNLHPSRGREKNSSVFNIAADCAINQHVTGLPADTISLADVNKVCDASVDSNRHTEYYYYYLEKHENKLTKLNSGVGDHSKWGESYGESRSRRVMEQVAENTNLDITPNSEEQINKKDEESSDFFEDRVRTCGNGLEKREKDVSDFCVPTIDWKEILQSLKDVKIKRKKRRSVYRRDRRYKHLPGQARTVLKRVYGDKQTKQLVVGVDVSDSISDKECSLFLQNLTKLKGWVEDLTVLQCSTEIVSENVVKKDGELINDFGFERKGGGGTSFEPVFNYVDQKYEDEMVCVLYLTDLCSEFPEEREDVDVVWVTPTRKQAKKHGRGLPFGEVYTFEQ